MLQASRQFGYDGVRFDGHWILGDVASGLGYDLQGRRPSGGDSPDKVSAQILQQVRDDTRRHKPDFAIGFNYGDHYQRGGARNPTAYRTACGKGGMILWEGATFGKDYSDWRRGAKKLRENALRVHQNGGIHYGQAHMTSITGLPCNDFSLRYYYITNFPPPAISMGVSTRDIPTTRKSKDSTIVLHFATESCCTTPTCVPCKIPRRI